VRVARAVVHQLLASGAALDTLGARGISVEESEHLPRKRHVVAPNPVRPSTVRAPKMVVATPSRPLASAGRATDLPRRGDSAPFHGSPIWGVSNKYASAIHIRHTPNVALSTNRWRLALSVNPRTTVRISAAHARPPGRSAAPGGRRAANGDRPRGRPRRTAAPSHGQPSSRAGALHDRPHRTCAHETRERSTNIGDDRTRNPRTPGVPGQTARPSAGLNLRTNSDDREGARQAKPPVPPQY
jgi:hypothetical protein